MPSTYSNIGLELVATGEQAGTWGETTNTNLEIIDEASNGWKTIILSSAGNSGSPNEFSLTDGAEADFRNKFLQFTSVTNLSLTAYVRMTPNTSSKVGYIKNALTDNVAMYVFQSDTFDVNKAAFIPAGETHIVTFNGSGTNAYCTSEIASGIFPTGDRDARRASPALGTVRYNSADKNLEVYNGTYDTSIERWSPLGCWELLDRVALNANSFDCINREDNDTTANDRTSHRYKRYMVVASASKTSDFDVTFRPIYANQDNGTVFFINSGTTGIVQSTVRGNFGTYSQVFRDQTILEMFPYSSDLFDAIDTTTFCMEWSNNSGFYNGPIAWQLHGAGVTNTATNDAETFYWHGNTRGVQDGWNVGWRFEITGFGTGLFEYAFYGLKATD